MKYLFLLLLCSCGNSINVPKKVQLEPTKPLEVKPVKVDIPDTTQTIRHVIDVTADAEMFRAECEEEFIEPEDIDFCMDTKLTAFLGNILSLQDALNQQAVPSGN
jgi:hypothetical protein